MSGPLLVPSRPAVSARSVVVVALALSDRRSWSGRWALLAAAMACGVALEYAVRQ